MNPFFFNKFKNFSKSESTQELYVIFEVFKKNQSNFWSFHLYKIKTFGLYTSIYMHLFSMISLPRCPYQLNLNSLIWIGYLPNLIHLTDSLAIFLTICLFKIKQHFRTGLTAFFQFYQKLCYDQEKTAVATIRKTRPSCHVQFDEFGAWH